MLAIGDALLSPRFRLAGDRGLVRISLERGSGCRTHQVVTEPMAVIHRWSHVGEYDARSSDYVGGEIASDCSAKN